MNLSMAIAVIERLETAKHERNSVMSHSHNARAPRDKLANQVEHTRNDNARSIPYKQSENACDPMRRKVVDERLRL